MDDLLLSEWVSYCRVGRCSYRLGIYRLSSASENFLCVCEMKLSVCELYFGGLYFLGRRKTLLLLLLFIRPIGGPTF
jgi:hypothetical protein